MNGIRGVNVLLLYAKRENTTTDVDDTITPQVPGRGGPGLPIYRARKWAAGVWYGGGGQVDGVTGLGGSGEGVSHGVKLRGESGEQRVDDRKAWKLHCSMALS